MQTTATVLRRFALVLGWLVSLGGLSFALAYAFEDPGGWAAAALTAAVLLSLGGLTVLALRAPETGFTMLATAVVLFAVWAMVDELVDLVDAPTVPVIALVLTAPITVLGQRQALRAGGLLAAMAAVPVVLVLVRMIDDSGQAGRGVGDLLTTSTGAVIMPLVVLAALLLGAGALAYPPLPPTQPQAKVDRRDKHPIG